MYCQLHRPVTSGSSLGCMLGHIGDRIYWIQKGIGLPDALGIVPPPYFPILHVGITLLVVVLLTKTLVLDVVWLTKIRRRNANYGGPASFARLYLRNALQTLAEMFLIASLINIIFLLIYRNTDVASSATQNPEIYSVVMRNKLSKYGIIF